MVASFILSGQVPKMRLTVLDLNADAVTRLTGCKIDADVWRKIVDEPAPHRLAKYPSQCHYNLPSVWRKIQEVAREVDERLEEAVKPLEVLLHRKLAALERIVDCLEEDEYDVHTEDSDVEHNREVRAD